MQNWQEKCTCTHNDITDNGDINTTNNRTSITHSAQIHIHTHTHIHTRARARTHTHTHTHTHARARTHARTHAHTHALAHNQVVLIWLFDEYWGGGGGEWSWVEREYSNQKGRVPVSRRSMQGYIFWPATCLKQRTFDSSGFSENGIYISASALLHCGVWTVLFNGNIQRRDMFCGCFWRKKEW